VGGCLTQTYKGTKLPENEIASLTAVLRPDSANPSSVAVRLLYVNDHYVSLISQRASMQPGKHTIKLAFESPRELYFPRYTRHFTQTEIKFTANAGKHYVLTAANIESDVPNEFCVEVYLMDQDPGQVIASKKIVFKKQ